MKTLLAWMIANVEMLTTVLLIAFFEYFLFHTPAGLWGGDRTGHAILGPLLVVLVKGMAGGYPSRSTLADLVNLVLLSTAFILLCIYAQAKGFLPTVIICGICALGLAVVAAIFTSRHMDEVVSLRMLYLNSRVSLFDIAWRYTFSRFVATFSGSFVLIMGVVWGIYGMGHPEVLNSLIK